jgi:SAM-dependent methyltransferase
MIATSATEGWQLDTRGAADYERCLAAAFGPWAEGLVILADLQHGERVLDVACGTGVVARAAAKRTAADNIVGVDVNDSMLAEARRVSSGMPIEWRLANAASLPFVNEAFDVVFCEQGLQFFSDARSGVNEMFRVLARGGRAAVSVCRSLQYCPAYSALGDLLDTVSAEAGAVMRSPFCKWDVDAFRALFTDAGFASVELRIEVTALRYASCDEFLSLETACSPAAEPIRALNPDARRHLVTALEAKLHEYIDSAGLVCPVQSYVALARRA